MLGVLADIVARRIVLHDDYVPARRTPGQQQYKYVIGCLVECGIYGTYIRWFNSEHMSMQVGK